MARIKSDGSIVHGTTLSEKARNPAQAIGDQFFNLPSHWQALLVAVIVFGVRHFLNPNPFADGKIPAASLQPQEHWKRIANDDSFVRSMTEHLGSTTHREGHKKFMTNVKNGDRIKDDVDIMLQRLDFGGPDGHVAERGDWSDIKYVQGTRCSTTRSALTAYFCGAAVAENQDKALEPFQRKHANFGVQQFADFLSCRHKQGQTRRSHRRSVYRIGIGCKDIRAGYSHAFSIVAQPDGTFYWLQSFIGHYSLPQWMNQMTAAGPHTAHLTLEEMLAKLERVERLMNIQGWTADANQAYYELFGVDKEKEALQRNKSPVRDAWKPSHRLQYFSWDEACEYPEPPLEGGGEREGEASPEPLTGADDKEETSSSSISTTPKGRGKDLGYADQCIYENLLQQLQLHGAASGPGRQASKQEMPKLLD